MLKLVIADDEGKTTVVPLSRDEITIGRMEGNTVRLTERNVSRRHARLVKTDDFYSVEDLGSFNGVRVNGRRVDGNAPLKVGDQIAIGDYILSVRTGPGERAADGVDLPEEPPTDVDPLGSTQSPLRLVMIAGPTPGKEFFLTSAGARVGRTEDLDIFVDDPSVSREHAEFFRDGDNLRIIDLGSASGVRVNGDDVEASELTPGDIVELGKVQFRVVGAGEDFTLAPDSDPAPPPNPNRSQRRTILAVAGTLGLIGIAFFVTRSGTSVEVVPPHNPPIAIPSSAVTPASPARKAPAPSTTPTPLDPVASLVERCQEALRAARVDDASALASQALAMNPNHPGASACRDEAEERRRTESALSQIEQWISQGNSERAWTACLAVAPSPSQPACLQARDAYARRLLSDARRARTPADRMRLADMALALPELPVALKTEIERARNTAPPATPPASENIRPEDATRPTKLRPRPTPTSQPNERPSTASSSTEGAPALSRLDEARACVMRGEHACVIRLLGRASNRSAQELELLIETLRTQSMWRDACAPMNEYIRRFGDTARARNFQQLTARYCQ